MTDFKSGGVPNPDYDSEDINFVNQKTEFTEDVFVYGKLYADLGGDVQTFSTAGKERLRITKDGDIIINRSGDPTHSTSSGSIFLEPPSYISTGNPNRGILWSRTSDTHYVKLEPSVIDGLVINGYDGVAFASGSRSNSTWSERFRIKGSGEVVFKPMTQTARDALNPEKGGVIFNQTTNKLQCWDGSSWNNLFQIDYYYTYAIIRIIYYQGMDDFVFEVVVDICSRTFKLKSDNGDNKIIACEDSDEFMRVLEVCDKMLEPGMIVYADLAITSDK